jgi:pilus assembly protein CpaC
MGLKRNSGWRRQIRLALVAVVALTTLHALATAQDQSPAAAPAAAPAVVASTDGFEKIMLEPGKAAKFSPGHRIKKANILLPDIADVVPLGPAELLVTAKKPGLTQLIIWDDSDRTHVVDVQVTTDIDMLRKQLAAMFPDCKITAEQTGAAIVLRGQVPDLQTADKASQVAASYGKVLNFLEVAGGQQIMLQVRFAEVSKQAENDLGFNFAGSDGVSFVTNNTGKDLFTLASATSSAPGVPVINLQVPTNPVSGIFGGGSFARSAFVYFVNALQTNNVLRLLAEPNLVTTSGQEATFLAGGSFPYPVPQSGSGGSTTITIQYQDYGVNLRFTPIALGGGRVRLKVAPEVSELDYSHSVTVAGTSVPGLTKRNVNTTVELAEGQTYALAGLLQDNVTASNSQFPMLGDLPVIGALFRSVQYQRNETELVVMVTPVLVHGIDPGDVTDIPGEKWRSPTQWDLFFKKDLGGEVVSASSAATQPSATDVAAGRPKSNAPAPLFQGSYGFSPAQPSAGASPGPVR